MNPLTTTPEDDAFVSSGVSSPNINTSDPAPTFKGVQTTEEDDAFFTQSPPVELRDSMGDNANIPPTKTTEEQKTETAPEGEEWGFGNYVQDIVKGGIRGVPSAVAEFTQFVGDIDEASKKYLGTLNFEDKGKKGFDVLDLFQIPDYISGDEYVKLKEQYGDEIKNGNLLYKISNEIDQARDKFITDIGEFTGLEEFQTPDTESFVGGLAEGTTQFATGWGITGKLTGLGNYGYKNLFLREAIVGGAFFDPEDSLITNFISPVMKSTFSEMSDQELEEWMAQEKEKAKDNVWVERGKLAVEGGVFGIGFLPVENAVTKVIDAVRGKKIAIEDAKLEQKKEGKVSDETMERIDAKGKIIAENAEEAEEIIAKAKPSKATIKKGKKISDNVQKIKAKTEEVKQKKVQANKEVVKSETKIHNELVEEFEDNLGINRDFIRGESGYITISTVKGGKRMLDPTKLEAAKNLAIRKIEEADVETSRLQTQQDPRMPQSIYIEKGIEDQYDMNELFDRVLKVENIEALTVVAKELRDADPEGWNKLKTETYRDKKTGVKKRRQVQRSVMEKIFDAVVSKRLTLRDDHPLFDALDKAGMSFEDFTLMHLGSASQAGKILNKYSQLARKVKPKSLKQQEELNEMLKNQSRTAQWFRRVENVRRGLLVSQIATAARNLESGLIRVPVEALNNIIETATSDIASGQFFTGKNRLLKRATWTDSFAGMRYIYSDRKTAKEFTDILLGDPNNPDLVAHPKLEEFSNMMFQTINEIQLATGRGSNTTFDKIMTKAEDFTQLLNTPNRWQDFMLRRGMFMGEAQRLFRDKWGIDLIEQLENGRLEDLLNDARDLNPTFKVGEDGKQKLGITAVEIFAEATERAMDLTYANPPESPFGKTFANFITNYNLTVLVPFPRFMAKSMELMAENSVGALLPVVRRIYGHTGYGAKTFGDKLTQREHRMIARNTTGALGIMAAMQMLQETDQQGEDYKLVPVGDGTVLDVTPLFPLRQFFFLGKIANEYFRASEQTDWLSGGKEAFFQTFDAREWAETFLGTSFRTGVAGNLVDEAASLFNNQDLTNDEWLAKNVGQVLGDYLSTFAVPMNQVIDLQRGLGARGLAYKETGKDPEIVSAGGAFLEAIKKPFRKYDPTGMIIDESALPKKEDPLQEERRRVAPLAKVALGLNMYTADSEEGRKLKELGFDKWDVSSRSRIPSVRNFENKLIRQNLPDIVAQAEGLENVWGEMYDANKESLSKRGGGKLLGLVDTGISREKYIKDEVKSYIKDMLNMFRNPDNAAIAIDDPQKVAEVVAMTGYRRLPTDLRNKGWKWFIEIEKRSPFELSPEYIQNQYPEFDELSDEMKQKAMKGLKLRDLLAITELGKASAN